MEQPLNNNASSYELSLLTAEDRRIIMFKNIFYLVPLIAVLLILAYLIFSLRDSRIDFSHLGVWLMIMLYVMIIFSLIHGLFKLPEYKEVFEAELDDCYGVFFVRKFWLKGHLQEMIPIEFFYRTNRLSNGKKYRVHKVFGKGLVLRMERLD